MRTFVRIVIVTSALCLATQAQALKGDQSDLSPISGWTKFANGIHKVVLGDHSKEMRYSDLAGAPPKLDALNKLKDTPIADTLKKATFRVSAGGKVLVRIPTEPGEKLFGFGLQFDNTMKSRRIVELKVDHFNKGGGATHAPVPFFISNRGYGVLFNTAKFIKFYNQIGNRKDAARNPEEVDRNPPTDEKQPGPWLAVPPSDAVEAYIHGKGIELIAFSGTSLMDIVARYNLFSGGGAMPPLWGLGFWHRVPAKFNAEQTLKEVAEFKEHNIPLDVIGLEPGWQTRSYPCTFEWQKKRFPDPAAFTKTLLDDGIRLNLWTNPYVSKSAGVYKQLYPLSGSHMVWLGIVPDYTLAAARKIILDQHKKEHFDIGISGYKIDEVDGYDVWLWPDHATFPSGTSAEIMRQIYGMLMQQMLHKELFKKNNKRTYSLVRASNAVASNHPFVLYSDSYGHEQYVTGISSASLSGILWCPEIRSAKNEREWINRMHTVCFSPMAMLNAWASGTKPWSYENATDAVRRTIELRMRLLPYLYTAFHKYHTEGIPPIRSMILEPHQSPMDAREDNSMFMFGADILVAPFMNSNTSRKVTLPAGDWFDFHTGDFAGNKKTITVTAKQTKDLPPLFVRDGAVIPMLKKSIARTRDLKGAEIEVKHYGKKDGQALLYEDDGATYDFAKGKYLLRLLTVKGDKATEETLHDGAMPHYGEITYSHMTEIKNPPAQTTASTSAPVATGGT